MLRRGFVGWAGLPPFSTMIRSALGAPALHSRPLATASTEACFYEVLEVSKTATAVELKTAFRQKAKLLHPDTSKGDQAAFVRLLTAYQVLSNPRSRELYDLSIRSGESRILRSAAAAGVRSGAVDEDLEVDISWGLSELFKQQPAGEQSTMLDKLRSELQSDLNAALRRAYLGPRLDLEQPHQLPDCFEADERSTPEDPALLELVSGRQLLAVVRERRVEQLRGWEGAEHESLGTGGVGAAAAGARGLLGAAAEGGVEGQRRPENGVPAEARSLSAAPVEALNGDASRSSGGGGSHAHPKGAASGGQQRREEGKQQQEEEAEVLELVMGEDEVVAMAVRQRQEHAAGAAGSSGGGIAAAAAAVSRGGSDSSGSSCEADAAAPALVISFYRGERLLGQLHAEREAAASNAPTTARFLNPEGVHTHTVLRSASPLVRHLSVVAEPTTGLAPVRRSRATVFRARRAWLPPSALWLFRPRNYQHDIGGWYVEWAGHEASEHPAWLDPAVCVLSAGFDTLDYERARRQPQGLFGRVRSGDETAGGPLAWVRAMLRFHRGGARQ